MRKNQYLCLILIFLNSISFGYAYELNWEASTTVNVGTGPFAPSLIMANRAGTITQSKGVYERVGIFRKLDTAKRFSYSFGLDCFVQGVSSVDYERWNPKDGELIKIARRPSIFTLQQLYGSIKYRCLYLLAGMKEHDRTFVDNSLSSGDLTLSNNARPIPQVKAGFYDFVNIPFTHGWAQIIGDIAYGKFVDSKWTENHYNYYNSFITTDVWFHYKRLYLRSNPEKRFVATVGMQHAAQFNGVWSVYQKGECIETFKPKHLLKSFLNVFIQSQYSDSEIAGEAMNFIGNHLGSWDLKFDYRLRNNDKISFYVMKPWEDGTGIGWQNGFDGVWGLAYKSASDNSLLKGVVLEYLDFFNQAGPFLYEPSENVRSNPTGGDDYYNNFMYNGWTNYGMGVGSPVLKSTIYNTDGYLIYLDNALRGFHFGADGKIGHVDWKVLLSWKQSKGTHYHPRVERVQSTSFMLSGKYSIPRIDGLTLEAQIGFDTGNLYPGCFGSLVSLSYKGNIFTHHKEK